MSDAVDWTLRSVAERLAEVERLRRERHGSALGEPMVPYCRIGNSRMGDVISERGDGSPRTRSGPQNLDGPV